MADLFGGHDVLFSWGAEGAAALSPHVDVLVVVDVLSFSTAVDVAVSRGATVFPYRFRDASAEEYARSRDAILASPWRQEGYSLSPASLVSIPPGTRLVLPSPNGATISAVAREAGVQVICGCLRNARTAADAAARFGRIGVIAAGERWPNGTLRPALEDLLGAGAILSRLPATSLSPDARASMAAYQSARIPADIADCPSGRELIEAGFVRDVEIAAAVDTSQTVPVLSDGFHILRTGTEGRDSSRPHERL